MSQVDGLGPLPPGRHHLTRQQVAHSQRERLIAALAYTVGERGYNQTTLTDITKAASVSRRVFYENFANKEECFLATFDVVVEQLRQAMTEAAEASPDWPHRVIAALRAALCFLSSEPDLARFCLVESVSAGPAAAGHLRSAVRSFAPVLRLGRAERSDSRNLADSTEDSLLGATVLLLNRSALAGEIEKLDALLPDLVEFLLTPYLGLDEAQRLAREAT
jgi:AcrR family transcriptional regulator